MTNAVKLSPCVGSHTLPALGGCGTGSPIQDRRASLTATTATCGVDRECEGKWSAARQWILSNARDETLRSCAVWNRVRTFIASNERNMSGMAALSSVVSCEPRGRIANQGAVL